MTDTFFTSLGPRLKSFAYTGLTVLCVKKSTRTLEYNFVKILVLRLSCWFFKRENLSLISFPILPPNQIAFECYYVVIGISKEGFKKFCPGSTTAESFDGSLVGHIDREGHGQWAESTFPSTVLQLLKENASHSAASLVEDCMVQLTLHGIMGKSYTCPYEHLNTMGHRYI